MSDVLTIEQIFEAVETLRANNAPPWECTACGRKFYVMVPRGYVAGQPLRITCTCGASKIIGVDR